MTITVPMAVESSNKWTYRPWYIYSNYKKKWIDALGYMLPRNMAVATQKRTVKIIAYRKRLVDIDNLHGGVKPILDHLRRTGYIVDDSPKYLKLFLEQRKSDTAKTEITVVERSR